MNRQQRHSDLFGFKHSSQPGWHPSAASPPSRAESLTGASAALQGKASSASSASHPSAHPPAHGGRSPQPRTLTSGAHDWLARLPPRYQPLATARRHPHIVNRLSALWDTPGQLPAYFRELMLSSRNQRAGFSFDVLTELTDLQMMLERKRH